MTKVNKMAELNNIYQISDTAEYNDFHYEDMPYPIFDEEENHPQKKDAFEKWILKNCYFQLSFYNQPNYRMSFPWDTKSFTGELDEKNIWWYNYPICQQLLNCMYVMQQQPNLNFNHLVKNVFSTNSHAAWMRGGRLASLVDYMITTFRSMFDGVKFTTEPISPDAIGERDKKLKREQVLLMLKPFIEKYLKDIVKFPEQQKPFETPQQIQEYMDTEWKDLLSDDYKAIAKNLWKNQYWHDDLNQIAFDVITNDVCGIEHIIINGVQHKLLHRTWNLIYDNRIDEPYGRRRRFSGALIQETPSDLFTRCPQLSEKQRKELYKIAIGKQGSNFGSFSDPGRSNTSPAYIWGNSISNFSTLFQDVTLDIVRMYWIAPEKIKGSEKPNLTVYTAEIVENKYLLNYGKANNIVFNKNNPQEPMLPLQIFTPNMKLGFPNSPVQRVRNIQDKIDKIEFKREELIGKNDGIIAFMNPELFGANTDPVDIERDKKLLGYIYTTPNPNGSNAGRLIETWDRRLDPSFQYYGQYIQELKGEMEQSLSQTAASLGETNKYIGKSAYEDSAEKGTGENSNLLTMTARFVQMNIEMAVNINKNLIASGLMDEEAKNIVGSDGLWRLKHTKDRFTMDFGIPIELNDKMELSFKDNLFKLLMPKLQNPNSGYTEGDLAKLYMITNFSKFRDEIKSIDDRINKERQEAQQMAMQQKQAQDVQKLQAEVQQLQMELGAKEKISAARDDVKREHLDLERQKLGLPAEHPHNPSPPSNQAQQQPPPQGQPPQGQPPQGQPPQGQPSQGGQQLNLPI